MPSIHKELTINALADELFELLDDPGALPRYAPGVSQVTSVQRSAGGIADSFQVTYSVMGLRFPSRFTTLAYARPTLIVYRFDGDLAGTFCTTLAPHGASTTVGIDIDYEIRGVLLRQPGTAP